MRRFGFIILSFVLGQFCLYGAPAEDQDTLNHKLPYTISSWYHNGFVLSQQRSIPYYIQDPVNGFEIGASRYFPKIDAKRPPEIGFGYYFSNMSNREIYGWTNGFFVTFGADFLKDKLPVYLHQTLSFGLSYNTKHFDILENPSNRVIGSAVNLFLIYSLNLSVPVGKNFILSAGPSFVHMSNGNMKHPNYGLNLVNTRLGLAYRLNAGSGSVKNELFEAEAYSKNRYMLFLSAGSRQVSRKIPENYLVGSFLTEYSRRISLNYAFGIGADFIFDPVEGMATYVSGNSIENFVPWHIGVHLTWERIWNKFSIAVQPGYKVITISEQRKYQYNRVSMHYRVGNNIILNCAIKANGIRADFVDFGVGYSFEK